MRLMPAAALAVLLSFSALAQIEPEGSESVLYAPSILVGQAGNTATELAFYNPNPTTPATVVLWFFGSDGEAWPLDFGSGPITAGEFKIPALGRRTFQAARASRTDSGWLRMFATVPVQMTVTTKHVTGQRVMSSTSYTGTLPTSHYRTPAAGSHEFCLSNPLGKAIRLQADAAGPEGDSLQYASFSIPPNGRRCFFPGTLLRALPAGFFGSLSISSASSPSDPFVAEHHTVDGNGYWTAAPSGRSRWPIAHEERIVSTFMRVWAAAARFPDFPGPDRMPELRILRNRDINAYAANGEIVAVELGLSQLISDSPSELAAVIGHEIGHIFQQRGGGLALDPRPEYDADLWGATLAISAGYDPYGIAGTLAKLSMATGSAGLISQFEEMLSGEAHGSFNERLSNVFEMLSLVCSLPDMRATCAAYKDLVHPNLPPLAPLDAPEPRPAAQTQRPSSRHPDMNALAKEPAAESR